MMQDSLAHRLRLLRAERGLTLREAAARSGVAKETISDIERGLRHPHDVTIGKLAKAYGVPLEDLLVEAAPALVGKAEAPTTGHGEPESSYAEISDEESERIWKRIEEAVRHLLGLSDEDPIPEEATQELHEAFMGAVRRVAQSEIEQHLDEAFAEREEQIEKREAELWEAFDRRRAEERERRGQEA